MLTHNTVYDVCRHYVIDNQLLLGDELFHKLMGYIRSRNVAKLAGAGDLYLPNIHGRLQFKVLRQIGAFFKKNSLFVNASCEDAALSAFEKAEEVCRITNKRLDHYYMHRDRLDPDVHLWMERAERYIHTVLGDFSVFLEEIPRRIRISSGASATHGRRDSMPYMKLRRTVSATRRARPYLEAISGYFGYKIKVRTREWNRVTTVPKNWKVNRTIACEQEGNIPLQLAFDAYCKDRLRKFARIDLTDQSKNQELARHGSLTGTLATVDLSAASDTIAYNTVAWLFPEPWLRYLDDIRAPFYKRDNSYKRYAKFSSMGNGATFAMETLIFAAACYAVGSKAYSVYGDDIIIETEKYAPLQRLLRFLGFTINLEKSYSSGPFRESCGADWYEGVDVTPFYLRNWSDRNLQTLSHNLNGLAAICDPGGALETFLLGVYSAHRKRLPLVPFNDVSTSGIWIDVHTCYSTKVLRTNLKRSPWSVRYRALIPSVESRNVSDSRALFLWHLGKILNPNADVQSSSVAISTQRFVRGWMCWFPPARSTPVHLYRWTELLTRP